MKINFPLIILSTFLIRLLITGASIGDSIVLLGLSALYAGWIYLETKKDVPVNKEILERVIFLEEQLSKTKDAVNGLKIASIGKR